MSTQSLDIQRPPPNTIRRTACCKANVEITDALDTRCASCGTHRPETGLYDVDLLQDYERTEKPTTETRRFASLTALLPF